MSSIEPIGSGSVDKSQFATPPASKSPSQVPPEALAAVADLLMGSMGHLGGALLAHHQPEGSDSSSSKSKDFSVTDVMMANTMQMMHSQIKQYRQQFQQSQKEMWNQ